MKEIKKNKKTAINSIGTDFFDRLWKESWTYIKTVVDVMREPILILDKDFRVMAANDPFYQTFRVKAKETENEIVYDLGNGQWNIPRLKKLLETILPKNTFFKGFKVTHNFPSIGRKIMILNARQIHFKKTLVSKQFSPIILLAIEDVTGIMTVAETFSGHIKRLEDQLAEQTKVQQKHSAPNKEYSPQNKPIVPGNFQETHL